MQIHDDRSRRKKIPVERPVDSVKKVRWNRKEITAVISGISWVKLYINWTRSQSGKMGQI